MIFPSNKTHPSISWYPSYNHSIILNLFLLSSG